MIDPKKIELQHYADGTPSILRKTVVYQELYFYKRSDILYQLTVAFCERFLPKYGDRTVDQMVKAARSGKQNIIEGSEDGKTSTEMELKLLNVARSSIGELCEDYQDHIVKHHLPFWDNSHPRYGTMLTFTQQHNALEDYEPYFAKWSEEEMANIGLTLCHQVDAMMNGYLRSLEKQFVTEGGIKERMYAARIGYRQSQEEERKHLIFENQQLQAELARKQAEIDNLKKQLEDIGRNRKL